MGLKDEHHVGQLQNLGAIVTSKGTLAEAACICDQVMNLMSDSLAGRQMVI